jgi:Flp pilus assembly pilin Flp
MLGFYCRAARRISIEGDNLMTKFFTKFRRDEKGVTLVEYGIALILAVAVGGTILSGLAGEVNTQLTQSTTAMSADN